MTAKASEQRHPSDEAQSVADKGIVITGGTSGIGRATAIRLVAEGARVFVFGRHDKQLAQALKDLRELSSEAYGVTADVTRPEDVLRVFQQAERALGQIDVLVNNASVGDGSIVEGKYEDWEYVVKTNVLGYMACAHEAVARMKQQGSGHIVNVGSLSADERQAGSSLYVATKSAIQGFSEALRKEVNEMGIKVTLIEPGAVGTDMQDESPEEQRAKQEKGEMLTAQDIAECIRYCLVQPPRCDVVVVQIRPHRQAI